jgi:hypothetical protein
MTQARPRVDTFRANLAIDPDDLNRCLEEQSSFYYDVAQEFALCSAERDQIKLERDEAMADLDKQIRAAAAAAQEKVTEDTVKNRVSTSPKVKDLNRRFLDAKAEADAWGVMKEAFQQRSFMLRELVALALAQLYNLNVERGVTSVRNRVVAAQGEDIHRRAGELRRERREQRGS